MKLGSALVIGSICAFTGFALLYPRSAPETTSSACGVNSAISGSSQVRVTGTGDRRTIELTLQLKTAPELVRVQPLIFVGERQVPNVAAIDLNCTESITQSYTANGFNRSSVVTVFRAPAPLIPDALKAQPSEAQARTVSAFPVDNNVFFYAEPKPISQNANRGVRWKYVSSPENAAHLEVSGQQHTFLQLDQPQKLPFKVRYGIAPNSPEEEKREHVITCLLNNAQFAAFDSQMSWTGKMVKRKAALLEGEVEFANLGWYVVRCMPLANLYANRDNPSFSPLTIAPLFVHVGQNKR